MLYRAERSEEQARAWQEKRREFHAALEQRRAESLRATGRYHAELVTGFDAIHAAAERLSAGLLRQMASGATSLEVRPTHTRRPCLASPR